MPGCPCPLSENRVRAAPRSGRARSLLAHAPRPRRRAANAPFLSSRTQNLPQTVFTVARAMFETDGLPKHMAEHMRALDEIWVGAWDLGSVPWGLRCGAPRCCAAAPPPMLHAGARACLHCTQARTHERTPLAGAHRVQPRELCGRRRRQVKDLPGARGALQRAPGPLSL